MTVQTPVRRDRKYFLSLELHREIDRLMRENPELVRERGLSGVGRVRPRIRSNGGRQLVDEWRRLLDSRQWDELHHRLTSGDEHSTEMRNTTVFLGLIPPHRREEIVESVTSRPGLLV